jgi:hypothetical protein
MGTYTYEKKNLALVLEPGARNCVIEVHPPLSEFAWEDRSGVDTNIILGVDDSSLKTRPRRAGDAANVGSRIER